MIKRFAALALLADLAAAPTMAATITYDAFASFNGTNGNGGFTYGSYDGTTLTAFTGDAGCSALISGVSCLGNLPGAFKTTSGAHVSGSVNVPGDALILHPGDADNLDSAVFFTAPTTGAYVITISAFIADNNPSGVNLVGINPDGSNVPQGSLSAAFPTYNLTTAGFLLAGQTVGFAINRGTIYNNDSTGFNFTFTTDAVPEPATWGLMIVGFGLVGVASRRRKGALAA